MDNETYAEKAEQLKARLYRIALLYTGNETIAADAVAEAIYRGLLSAKKIREPAFFETWMTRILINECKKAWNRVKSRREEPIETLTEQAAEAFDSLPLKEAIRQLPHELREVVILRYYSDFTLAETAKVLNIPQGTTATRQRRALKLLRLELLEEDTK